MARTAKSELTRRKRLARKMRREGVPVAKIAEELGCTPQTVNNYLRDPRQSKHNTATSEVDNSQAEADDAALDKSPPSATMNAADPASEPTVPTPRRSPGLDDLIASTPSGTKRTLTFGVHDDDGQGDTRPPTVADYEDAPWQIEVRDADGVFVTLPETVSPHPTKQELAAQFGPGHYRITPLDGRREVKEFQETFKVGMPAGFQANGSAPQPQPATPQSDALTQLQLAEIQERIEANRRLAEQQLEAMRKQQAQADADAEARRKREAEEWELEKRARDAETARKNAEAEEKRAAAETARLEAQANAQAKQLETILTLVKPTAPAVDPSVAALAAKVDMLVSRPAGIDPEAALAIEERKLALKREQARLDEAEEERRERREHDRALRLQREAELHQDSLEDRALRRIERQALVKQLDNEDKPDAMERGMEALADQVPDVVSAFVASKTGNVTPAMLANVLKSNPQLVAQLAKQHPEAIRAGLDAIQADPQAQAAVLGGPAPVDQPAPPTKKARTS